MQSTTDSNHGLYPNKVKTDCRFYDRPEICKEIQVDCNCYACDIARCKILENDRIVKGADFIQLERKIQILEYNNARLTEALGLEGLKGLQLQSTEAHDTVSLNERNNRRKRGDKK